MSSVIFISERKNQMNNKSDNFISGLDVIEQHESEFRSMLVRFLTERELNFYANNPDWHNVIVDFFSNGGFNNWSTEDLVTYNNM